MLPPADQLVLRKTVIGGESAPDDYQVIWSGFSIGRILKHKGLPPGRPEWSWSIIFAHRPQEAWHKGHERDLEAAKARFRLAWKAVHATLTAADVDAEISEKESLASRPWNRRGGA